MGRLFPHARRSRAPVHRLLLVLAVAAFLLPLHASGYISTGPGGDTGWYWENPMPQGNFLTATSFVDPQHGWAVGQNGTVLRTADGGTTWTYLDPGVSRTQRGQRGVNGVAFADATRGWIAGAGGLVKRTADAGATWTTQTVPATASGQELNAIASWNASSAIAVGQNHTIMYTTDAGANWRTPATNPLSGTGALHAVSWATATTAYAVGDNGAVVKTTDAGSTWAALTSGTTRSLQGVSFAPGTATGYAVGLNGTTSTILRTTNGGSTWTTLASPANVPFHAVDMLDADTCAIAGGNGAVFVTSNASAGTPTWTNRTISQLAGPGLALAALQLTDATHLVTVGDAGATFTSSDLGATWVTQSAGTTANLMTSWFTDASTGWAAGAGGTIVRTVNGGASWIGTNVGTGMWRGMSFANASYGLVVGDGGAIRVTNDGGVTWTAQTSGTSEQLNAVWCTSAAGTPALAIAVGRNGALVRSTDAGATWTTVNAGTAQPLHGVYMTDALHGWAVGKGSTIVHTADGGLTWTVQKAPQGTKQLNAVRGIPGTDNVWIVGNGGLLWSTTNGTTWTDNTSMTGTTQNLYSVYHASTAAGWISGANGTVRYWPGSGTFAPAATTGLGSGTTIAVRSVVFPDGNTGYFAGDAGMQRKSTDAGRNWISQQYTVYSRLNDVAFGDAARGWIAGDGGVILASVDGGDTWFAQTSGANSDLFGVAFPNGTNGYAVGAAGTIRHTVNGGGTWAAQPSGTTKQLNGVAAPAGDALHAVAVGNAATLLRTSDAGSTWIAATPPAGTGNVTAVSFPDTTTAGIALATCDHAVGSGAPGIIRSTDYGATWSVVSTASQPFASLDFAPAPHAATGWAVGASGTVYKTTDTGLTWVPQVSNAPGDVALADVSVLTTAAAYAVGGDGVIVETTDGGATWAPQDSGWGSAGSNAFLRASAFIDPTHGFAVGAFGTILRTTQQLAPITTLYADPPLADGGGGWHLAPPTITLASDQQGTTCYAWDSPAGPFTAYAVPLTAPEGVGTVYYYSVNAAGREETVRSAVFRTDTTDPAAPGLTSAAPVNSTSAQVSFASAGTDAGSGVAYHELWYQAQGAAAASLGATVSPLASSGVVMGLIPDTDYTFWFVTRDLAGNSSVNSPTATAKTLSLDALSTLATATPATPNGSNGFYVEATPTVSLATTPPAVPAWTYYAWDSGSTALYTGPLTAPAGVHTLSYYSIDQAGLRGQENTRTLTLRVDSTAPSAPSTITASALSTSSVALQWASSTDTESVVDSYEVFVDGSFVTTVTGAATATVSGLQVDTAYDFLVRAVNGAGLTAQSATASARTLTNPGVYTAYTWAPALPDGENGWYVTTPTVTLASMPSTVACWTYYWWGGSAPVTYTPAATIGPAADGTVQLSFCSVDKADAMNRETTQALRFDVDRAAPAAPAAVFAGVTTTTSIEVTWTAGSDASPGSGVDHYLVYVDAVLWNSAAGTGTVVEGLAPSSLHTIRVAAVDAAGNGSGLSAASATGLTDAPATFETSADVWPAVADGVAGWYVTTPTVSLTASPTSEPSYTAYAWDSAVVDTYTAPLTPPTGAHTLSYWSIDQAGLGVQEATKTLELKVDTWPDVTTGTPSPAGSVAASAAIVTDTSVLLRWPPMSEPYSGQDHYEVWGGASASTFQDAYLVSGLVPSTAYEFRVVAVNGAGTRYSMSATVSVTTSAAALPVPPAAVAAQAPDGGRVFVDWQPVAAYVGQAGYQVWRSTDGEAYSRIATLTGQYASSYTDTGLRSSTRYFYAVSAFDDRGESALSDTSTASWAYNAPTTGRPQRVEGLRKIEGSGTAVLDWLPSVNPATVGYQVLRADRSLGAVTTLTPVPLLAPGYTDLTLTTDGPYYYSVVAVDMSGTIGRPSLELEVRGREAAAFKEPHQTGPEGGACICHSSHAGIGAPSLRAGTRPENACWGCHTPGVAVEEYADSLNVSTHGVLTSVTPSAGEVACGSCHRPVHDADEPLGKLLLTDGNWVCVAVTGTPGPNGLCYRCHGPASTLPQGDLSVFETSAHSVVPTSSDNVVACDACHESHASRNAHLNKFADFMVCVQCHNASTDARPDIWEQLQASEETGTKLPLLPEDQAGGGRIACQNCHNSHALTADKPLVDPHDPSPAGAWAGPRGDLSTYCFRCHDGEPLPTSAETSSWAEPVLANCGATMTSDIQLAYSVNVHGWAAASDPTQARLRPDMGYVASGEPLKCEACHVAHGSSNKYALRTSVASADGAKSVDGLLVYRTPAGGHDLRFFCTSCHLWDSASHDSLASTSTVSFPVDCTACHRHLNADGTGCEGL